MPKKQQHKSPTAYAFTFGLQLFSIVGFCIVALSLVNSHHAFALSPLSYPTDVQQQINGYDFNGPGVSPCLTAPDRQYDYNDWLSSPTDQSNDSTITVAGNEEINQPLELIRRYSFAIA